jgi:hypothetical protein
MRVSEIADSNAMVRSRWVVGMAFIGLNIDK